MRAALRTGGGVVTGCLGLVLTVTARADVPVSRLAVWPIVLSEQASPADQQAATELRECVARAAGGSMAIVSPGTVPAQGVFLGAAADLPSDDLDEESFRLRIAEGRIDIAGGGPRGTLYGVYTLLEDYLGVRFLTPDVTHVPRAAASLVLPAGERVVRPRFAWRYSYYAANSAHPQLAAHLRNNAVTDRPEFGGRSPWTLISHTVNQYVPVARYGREHPEYFSLVDGRRRSFMTEDHFEAGGTQPCFSNPEVRRLLIDGALRQLAERGQTSGNVSISQNDNTKYCQCDACRAIDEQEQSHMGSLLSLINEAADAVNRERPGVFVGTLSYQYSRTAPVQMRPRPNVAIQLCSIEACMLHPLDDPQCPQNVTFCKDLEQWCKICDQVYVWNYNVNFSNYNAPCPNLDVIGPNVRFLAQHHVRGVFMQAAGNGRNTELSELRNYLISRLLWDPQADADRLREEFITLYYGQAAGKVREYLELIHDTAQASGLHRNCFGSPASYGITEPVARRALELLAEGAALAESEEVRRRVEKITIAPRTVLIEPFLEWASRHRQAIRAGQVTSVPADLYRPIESELREVFSLFERHGVDHVSEQTTVADLKQLLTE